MSNKQFTMQKEEYKEKNRDEKMIEKSSFTAKQPEKTVENQQPKSPEKSVDKPIVGEHTARIVGGRRGNMNMPIIFKTR